MKGFFQRILQEIMKKIILGTSDAWSTLGLSYRASDQADYIEDLSTDLSTDFFFTITFKILCKGVSSSTFQVIAVLPKLEIPKFIAHHTQ